MIMANANRPRNESLLEEAEELDERDTLARFRGRFYLPLNMIYLDGNSLGPLCFEAERAILAAVTAWKTQLIEGWTGGSSPWFTLAERLGGRVAALLGAEEKSVVVTGSTTTNLHQLLASLLPREPQPTIVADCSAFPSDLYALRSSVELRGLDPAYVLRLVAPGQNGLLQESALIEAMAGAQMVVLPAVVYTTGQMLNMGRLTEAAHDAGAIIGFDCAHSIGSVEHHLDQWGVDFAFWCSYKHLNGGPGATGGLYLNRRHWDIKPGLAGWFGSAKDKQMRMASIIEPAEGAGRLQIGTPNILSMAPLEGALDIVEEAGIRSIRRKSIELTDFMLRMFKSDPAFSAVRVITPEDPNQRGGHVTLQLSGASGLSQALRAHGVVPDYRPPDMVRLAPAPLFTSFKDCYQAIQKIAMLLEHPTDWQHLQPGLIP